MGRLTAHTPDQWLPATAPLTAYQAQAEALLAGFQAGEPAAIHLVQHHHPQFLREDVPWLPKMLSPDEVAQSPFDREDARLAVARGYSFRDWESLEQLVQAVERRQPGVWEFEMAAEAVITGDLAGLEQLLASYPEVARARSTRVTNHNPAVHGATLPHYVAANGVEDYRQRTPANAVEITERLLKAGADPNALAGMYGGECTVLAMLASSGPPAEAGVQLPLIDLLIARGADPDGGGTGNWTNPLLTALLFGFREVAERLAAAGARADRLALAAQLGHAEVVRLLLDAGEDPDRYNPAGFHAHATPLHHAALEGHFAVVQLLVEWGARVDLTDTMYRTTPRRWAEHGGHTEVAEYLRSREK